MFVKCHKFTVEWGTNKIQHLRGGHVLPYNCALAGFIQILVHGQVQLSDGRSDWWVQIENLHQNIAAAVLNHLTPHCLTKQVLYQSGLFIK